MHHLEKIEYKPIPVRDLLLEMKNLSQLMIDLAYSSALFGDKELAEDVLELENRVDTLSYLLGMEIMLAARDVEDAEALIGVSTVASAANKISDAAADIAVIVKQNIILHPIISAVFEKVEERLMRAKVVSRSELIGQKIGVLDLASRMGVDIIAILRNKDWLIDPDENLRIQSGDILIARGAPLGIREFKEIVEGEKHKLDLHPSHHRNSKQFEKIVERFVELKDTSELMIDLAYSSLLLNGKELAEEVQRLEEYMDKLHTTFELLVLSSDFKKEDAPSVLGLIRLGVVTEGIADAASEIAEVVLRGIEPHPLLKITIEEAEETVTSVRVALNSPFVNKTLKELRVPEKTGMWVLALRRGAKCFRPKPSTRVKTGDILIASGYSEGESDLEKLAAPDN